MRWWMSASVRSWSLTSKQPLRRTPKWLRRTSRSSLTGVRTEPWAVYLDHLQTMRHGCELPPGWVPGALLAADVQGELVGHASIRFALNDLLTSVGGHIGYCVLPRYRRRGYATEILRQSLIIARAEGVDRVLVTCDEHNVGSATVVERAGGILEDVRRDPTGVPRRRYWIR